MNKMTVKDINLENKKVLMRVDFNVPQDENGNITDDLRIVSALETIRYCLEKGAKKVILMSHLGRPKGKAVESMRLTPVAKRLSELLKIPVKKLNDCVGEAVETAVNAASEKVVLLENLRFYAEEEKNDAAFAQKLAKLGDIFVNDAFGTAHRAHASTEGVTHYLPAVAGFLLEKEIAYLGNVVENPERPLVTILGGAKVSDKIKMIENMMDKVNCFLIGGGMAYTFLKAQGKEIGNSKVEEDKLDLARMILKKAQGKNISVILPVDNIAADAFKEDAATQIVGEEIPQGWMGLDIGPKTVEMFKRKLDTAKTIIWNGPVGVFEMKPFSAGTKAIAEYIAGLKVTSVIGGGDTASAVAQFGVEDKMSHVSTGGGASLELLEGLELPGIAALKDKTKFVFEFLNYGI
ncbi:MAG: phosphoglycerate kinase [Candidatus Omnitrophica bacterium]|nr:phosphoglycerate kinase [Candidatus Omnitrophota bacterium]MBU4479656.1 phosphoglycerate kinase [Candidatus Omnitrophota bacterium]